MMSQEISMSPGYLCAHLHMQSTFASATELLLRYGRHQRHQQEPKQMQMQAWE